MSNKQVKYVKMDIYYYGIFFPYVKYYPAKEEELDSFSLKTEDGYWFGFYLNQQFPVNVHIFYFDGKWQTNCECCERDADGEWYHYYDSNIYCENVIVKYIH